MILFSDFDNTLFFGNDDRRTGDNVNAIKKWRSTNNQFCITTGCSYKSIIEQFPEILAYANGGYFPQGLGGAEVKITYLPYENENSKFIYAETEDELGIPISYDETKRFLGYATSPDATEPDVIDGETDLLELGIIYAVWGDIEEEPDEDEESAPDQEDENVDGDTELVVPDTGENTKESVSMEQTSCVVVTFAAVFVVLFVAIRYFGGAQGKN